jgi:predicted nuclease of restriction endonuclease-like (RecB) superfamily
MRQFADAYSHSEIVPLLTAQFDNSPKINANPISQSETGQLQTFNNEPNKEIVDFVENVFFKVGFTQHITILDKCKIWDERLFYLKKCVENQWTVSLLEHHIESDLYGQKGKMINNFDATLPEKLNKFATNAFKGELLIDFINIDEDEDDERVFENEIVRNIKKFIMSLGSDFAFLGNQYRLVIEDEEEVFVDLLFFHRKLQCLVAFELKKGKFKAEYAGKMNLYLSALDEYVKQPHENPSIGIILCKKKNDKYVEFAFRDVNKPMGVATYKTSREIPEKYKGLLPKPDDLIRLL